MPEKGARCWGGSVALYEHTLPVHINRRGELAKSHSVVLERCHTCTVTEPQPQLISPYPAGLELWHPVSASQVRRIIHLGHYAWLALST